MATVNLGSIRFNWKGAYNNSTAYVVNDVVTSSGNSYVCIQASQGNAVGNATAYWNIMSSAGTNGTDLTSTLTTRGDIVYKGASALTRLPKGTAGYYLKQGANDPEWAELSGGDVVKIAHSTNISNQSEIQLQNVFTLGTYTYYMVIFEGVYSASSAQMRARFFSSGTTIMSGGAYLSTGYETGRATAGSNYHSHRNHSDNYIEIQDNFADSAGYPSHMVFEFFNPMKTGARCNARYYHTCWSGTGWLEEKDMAVTYTDTGVVSGMTLYTNGQNTTCNSVKIYGFK